MAVYSRYTQGTDFENLCQLTVTLATNWQLEAHDTQGIRQNKNPRKFVVCVLLQRPLLSTLALTFENFLLCVAVLPASMVRRSRRVRCNLQRLWAGKKKI